ncbi:MAG TPA: inosine/xanthosine triphosphatase [Candidatus Saccharimonadales bacterium]
MIINVGSKNRTKIEAVTNLVSGHPLFKNVIVNGVEVDVEEFGHPKTLKDTIYGAKQRAKQAFVNCSYSFGLESGMFKSSGTKSGYLETTVCAIYDGERYHIGLSPSFEWPAQMVKLILEGLDGSQAFKELGLTDHEKIGTAEGAIHILTHGKINREKLNEIAVMMALIHLENPEHY